RAAGAPQSGHEVDSWPSPWGVMVRPPSSPRDRTRPFLMASVPLSRLCAPAPGGVSRRRQHLRVRRRGCWGRSRTGAVPGQLQLPATVEGPVDLDQAQGDIALRLGRGVLLLHQELLGDKHWRVVDRPGREVLAGYHLRTPSILDAGLEVLGLARG